MKIWIWINPTAERRVGRPNPSCGIGLGFMRPNELRSLHLMVLKSALQLEFVLLKSVERGVDAGLIGKDTKIGSEAWLVGTWKRISVKKWRRVSHGLLVVSAVTSPCLPHLSIPKPCHCHPSFQTAHPYYYPSPCPFSLCTAPHFHNGTYSRWPYSPSPPITRLPLRHQHPPPPKRWSPPSASSL